MRSLLLSLAAVVLGLVCTTAQASTVTYGGVLPSAATDWTSPINIPQYNPSQGTLQSVTLILKGSADGTGYYENRGANPTTISLTLSGLVTLTPSGSSTPIATINPSVTQTYTNVPGYDGHVDYAGTSGATVAMVTPVVNQTVTLLPTDAGFAAFLGTSTLNFDLAAKATSAATGSGNLRTGFDTNAGGSWEVQYTYVPEPATMALLALGGLGLIRRRR